MIPHSFIRLKNLAPSFNSLLWAALIVPLQPSTDWKEVHYSKIPPNEIQFDTQGLTIKVNSSSSPLFFDLKRTIAVSAIHAIGAINSFPALTGEIEGTDHGDDFALRIGIVEAASEKPNWLEKLLAPDWLKRLIKLFPDKGFSRVVFYNVAQQWKMGTERVHPKNKHALERVGLEMKKPGPFKMDVTIDPPIWAFALWLHPDGDDSQSNFEVKLNRLNLEVSDSQPN